MLANAMIFSRFRYWAQCMSMPREILEAVVSDAQALVWGRDVAFDAAERGTEITFRRYMRERSQFGNRKKELGVGLLD